MNGHLARRPLHREHREHQEASTENTKKQAPRAPRSKHLRTRVLLEVSSIQGWNQGTPGSKQYPRMRIQGCGGAAGLHFPAAVSATQSIASAEDPTPAHLLVRSPRSRPCSRWTECQCTNGHAKNRRRTHSPRTPWAVAVPSALRRTHSHIFDPSLRNRTYFLDIFFCVFLCFSEGDSKTLPKKKPLQINRVGRLMQINENKTQKQIRGRFFLLS
jgi:hypothetical protein